MALPGFNAIIDLNHNDTVTSWDTVHQNGVHAVIHKATEGTTFQDPAYHGRRKAAKAAGLLFGSYHFTSGGDVTKQIANYLSWAQPAHDELIAIDCEKSSGGGADMTLQQLLAFVSGVEKALGRKMVVYGGGDLLKPITRGETGSPLGKCPLWIASYPKTDAGPGSLPDPWKTNGWTIWQYTDGKNGPPPHTVPGVMCDRDTYNGSGQELHQRWPLT
jgi:lysozyme